MTRQLRYIIITVCVLAVLGVGLVLIKVLPGAKNTASSSASSSSTSKSLIKLDSSDVKLVQVSNSGGAYTIRKNGDNWAVDELSDTPLSQANITNIVTDVTTVTAQKTISDDSTDLTPYGLSTPSATFKLTTNDDKTYSMEIGGKSPGNNYGYYAMLDGDSHIYLLDATTAEDLQKPRSGLVDLSLSAVSSSEFAKLTAFDLGGSQRTPIKIAINESAVSGYTATTDSNGSTLAPAYNITSPGKYEANADSMTTLSNGLTSLSATDFITSDQSDASLDKYGLKNPSYTLTYTYNGKDTAISFGSAFQKDGTNYVYVMVSGKKAIYDITASTVPFYNWKLLDVAPSLLFTAPNIDTVKTITVTAGSKTWKYDLSNTGENLVVQSGGKKLDTSNFRNFYRQLLNFSPSGESTQTSGNEVLKITFDYRTVTMKSEVLEFRSIDAYRAEFIVNENANFYVKQSSVDNVIQYAQDIISGKTVPQP